MQIIDGRQIAAKIEAAIKETLAAQNISLSVASIFIGAAHDSALYTKRKADAAKRLGINFLVREFSEAIDEDEAGQAIVAMNSDKNIDSYIVQLPLPVPLRPATDKLLNMMSPAKDVDGLTEINRQNFLQKKPGAFIPTPVAAVLTILNSLNNDNWLNELPFRPAQLKLSGAYQGQKVIIISDGDVFAAVLKFALVEAGLEVGIVTSDDSELASKASSADILISAIGRPAFLKSEYIKKEAIVIDVGTTLVEGKTVGDFYWPDVQVKASQATPVPGGVGPVTVAMLFANALYLKSGRL